MAQDVGAIYYTVDAHTEGLLIAGRDVDRASSQMSRSMKGAQHSAEDLSSALGDLKKVALGVSAALASQKVIKYADAWTNLTNKIKVVSASQEEAATATQGVLDVARRSYTDITATADLYSKLARSTDGLGLSQKDLLRITETINKSFAVSGATADEANNAIIQLGQGLSAGALRGDEFNSVAEQAPAILRAVAAETGMTVGQLRAFAATGGITTELLIKSLQSYASTADNELGKATRSFSQHMTNAKTNMTALVGDMQGLTGAVQGAGSAIEGITLFLSRYSSELDITMGALSGAVALYGAYRAVLLTATAAQIAFNVAMRANPFVMVASALGAVAGALYSVRNRTMELNGVTGTVTEYLKEAWGLAAEKVSGVWDETSQGLKKAFQFVADTFGVTTDDIKTFFTDAMDTVVGAAKLAVNSAISAFLSIPTAVKVVCEAIIKDFGEAWIAVGEASKKAMKFDFSGARKALDRDFIDPLETGEEIANRLKKNFSTDWIGNAIGEIGKIGDTISNRVASNQQLKKVKDSLQGMLDFSNMTEPSNSSNGVSTSSSSGNPQKTQKTKANNDLDSVVKDLSTQSEQIEAEYQKRNATILKYTASGSAAQNALLARSSAKRLDDLRNLNDQLVGEYRTGSQKIVDEYADRERQINKEMVKGSPEQLSALKQNEDAKKKALDDYRRQELGDLVSHTDQVAKAYEDQQRAIDEVTPVGSTENLELHTKAFAQYQEASEAARNQDYEQQAGHLQRMRDLESAHYALLLQYQEGYSAESAQKLAEIRKNTEDPLKTMGQSLTDSFVSLDDTISNAFVNGVSQGKGFNAVLREIGQTVLASILQSFVKLGVQMAIQAAVGNSLQAASTVAATTSAGVVSAAWQPAAIAASIATLGGAAATGLASYSAAMAGGVAGGAISAGFGTSGVSVAGGRANGGPVNAGSLYQVTENGKPELYSDGTRQYLLPGKNGQVTSNKDMQGGGGSAAAPVVNIHNYGTSVASEVSSRRENGRDVYDVLLRDIDNNGEFSQRMQHRFKIGRRFG